MTTIQNLKTFGKRPLSRPCHLDHNVMLDNVELATTFAHRLLYIPKISPVIRTGERERTMVANMC
jgi:hypothetical protein